MIFNPSSAPKNRDGFMQWYAKQTEWTEDHGYDDPKVASEDIQNWFLEMINTFPAMNGPYATQDLESDYITDYCIGQDMMYIGFRWTVAEEAYGKTLELAEKHKVGFFDVSANQGNIFFPNENGGLGKVDNPDKESSIEEIKAWSADDTKSVADVIFGKVDEYFSAQKDKKSSWLRNLFKRKK